MATASGSSPARPLPSSCGADSRTADSDTFGSLAARALALRGERAGELFESVLDDGRVADVGEQRVELLAHRALGQLERCASGRSDGESDRAAVAVDRGALDHAV